MAEQLKPGASATLEVVVAADQSISLQSADRQTAVVFSTPSMINLMEHAARAALAPYLEPDQESVGAMVTVEHLAATPVGARVRATATVTSVDGRLVDFEIEAFDQLDRIGRGTHRRAIIRTGRFAERLVEKTQQLTNLVTVGTTGVDDDLTSLETLRCERNGPVLTVRLNRPPKRNAVDTRMTTEWERVNAWLQGHRDVRVVIISGSGEGFCAGDDVPEVGTLSPEQARHLSLRQARMYLDWEKLPQVFIAAIHGDALGGGCVMACACDLRLAATSARFGMPEIRLGWPPGYGVAQLTALIGKARALELCLTGQPVSARKAEAIGLVNEVVPGSRLAARTGELVGELLSQPAEALRETKRLVHGDEPLSTKLAYIADTEAYIRCLALPDAQEGIRAFREKRPPRWTGD